VTADRSFRHGAGVSTERLLGKPQARARAAGPDRGRSPATAPPSGPRGGCDRRRAPPPRRESRSTPLVANRSCLQAHYHNGGRSRRCCCSGPWSSAPTRRATASALALGGRSDSVAAGESDTLLSAPPRACANRFDTTAPPRRSPHALRARRSRAVKRQGAARRAVSRSNGKRERGRPCADRTRRLHPAILSEIQELVLTAWLH
jgi:hypothetical protein